MVTRKEIPQAPPPFTHPFVDANGIVTPPWSRWLLNSYAREGAGQDDIYTVLIQALVSGAQISSLYAQLDQQATEIEALRSLVLTRQSYDDQIEELRGLIEINQQGSSAVQQQLETLRQAIETEAQAGQLLQVANSAAALSSSNSALSGLDGKENTITPGTNLQYWRGDKTFQTLDTSVVPENGNLYFTNARAVAAGSGTYATIASLAMVATSGAYSDLTGRPTLGTAAAQNTGTSGANVPLLNGVNTWGAVQMFSVPAALPSYTVAGLPSAASNTNGIAIATDLLAPAIGAIAVGGGAVRSVVLSDGTNWRSV